MKLSPLDDRVLVQPLEAEEITSGGIILPDGAREKPQSGTVVAVGPGRLNDDGARSPVAVKKGDVVVFNQYGGTDVTLDGEDYKVLREDEILAKFRK